MCPARKMCTLHREPVCFSEIGSRYLTDDLITNFDRHVQTLGEFDSERM